MGGEAEKQLWLGCVRELAASAVGVDAGSSGPGRGRDRLGSDTERECRKGGSRGGKEAEGDFGTGFTEDRPIRGIGQGGLGGVVWCSSWKFGGMQQAHTCRFSAQPLVYKHVSRAHMACKGHHAYVQWCWRCRERPCVAWCVTRAFMDPASPCSWGGAAARESTPPRRPLPFRSVRREVHWRAATLHHEPLAAGAQHEPWAQRGAVGSGRREGGGPSSDLVE